MQSIEAQLLEYASTEASNLPNIEGFESFKQIEEMVDILYAILDCFFDNHGININRSSEDNRDSESSGSDN